MDSYDTFMMTRVPTAERPLMGLTVLVVEDSRFASEAMRLLCLRSGARIRRADCLKSARRHLGVYRPSVVIVDLGLPDGSGADLIQELHTGAARVDVILATSGDDGLEDAALAAGADGFIAKPIESLAVFQSIVLANLPGGMRPIGPRLLPDAEIRPDPIAFRDDLISITRKLSDKADKSTLDYVAQFLSGVARSAHDRALETAAGALARDCAKGNPRCSDIARLAGIVQERLERTACI